MPIIDSRSNAKFDAIIRTNKGDALLSFIKATSSVKTDVNRKEEIAKRLKSAYELFKTNVQGAQTGAGSYGSGENNLLDQFERHYTMALEMAVWKDQKQYQLTDLALKVANYEITIRQYIGVIFLNLFSYYKQNDMEVYHHYLYEILKLIESGETKITSYMIKATLPEFDRSDEQAKLIYNYLSDSDYFVQDETGSAIILSPKWSGKLQQLISMCNLLYANGDADEVKNKFKQNNFYTSYVTKVPEKFFNDSIYKIEEPQGLLLHDEGDLSKERLEVGRNIILYGVPGSGKSWTIKNEYVKENTIANRIVFHPEYTYADFVGQILPVVRDAHGEKIMSYSFVPGPFTLLLKQAILNPGKECILIIEEINRGNAAAIFGDIFQLLDRKKNRDDKDNETPLNTSEYSIKQADIAEYIYKNKNEEILIPSNMTIIGTMNTSDQNAFTLDTAFQRRWEMRMIENSFGVDDTEIAAASILDTSVTWKHFCETINDLIIKNNDQITSSEDKRLGKYFITKSDLVLDEENIQNNRKFAEKVVKYLWDDVFKFSRDEIFETNNYPSLEAIINHFINSVSDERLTIFNKNILSLLIK